MASKGMTSVKKTTLLALGLAASLWAGSAIGARADDDRSSFVRQQAAELLEGSLSDEQFTTLQLLAHQAAIAAACDGFTLDPAKFERVFATIAPADGDKLNDAQENYFDTHLLVVYGVLLGGELSDMADDISDACTTAAADKINPDIADVLVWQ